MIPLLIPAVRQILFLQSLEQRIKSLIYKKNGSMYISVPGSPVSQWDDIGLNRKNLTQSTATNKPTISNGAIVFDGINDYLSCSGTFNLDNLSVFLRYKINNFSNYDGYQGIISFSNAYNGQDYADSNGWFASGSTIRNTATGEVANRLVQTQERVVEFNLKGSNIDVYCEGVLIRSSSFSGTSGNANFLAIGTRTSFGPGSYLPIEIKKVLIVNAINASDRSNINRYLGTNTNRKRTIFVGDSLTADCYGNLLNSPTEAYPSQYNSLSGRTDELCINYGEFGIQVSGLINPDAVLNNNQDKLVVYIGSNNLSNGDLATTIKASIDSYVSARISAGWASNKIFVCTVTPRTDLSPIAETQRMLLNTSLYETYGANCIDFAADSRLSNASDTTYYLADGIHHNAAGCAVKAAIVNSLLP